MFLVNNVEDTTLRMLQTGDLPNRHRVIVHVKYEEVFVRDAVDLLGRQNEGIQSEDWIIVWGSESSGTKNCLCKREKYTCFRSLLLHTSLRDSKGDN